jgi:hypothetical protein
MTGGKRKRKHDSGRGKGADRGSDDETGASGSDAPRQTMSHKQVAQAALDLKKRTKTVYFFFSSLDLGVRSKIVSSNAPAIRAAVEKSVVMSL